MVGSYTYFNDMATLMFNTQEVAVKQLFHQNGTNSVAHFSLSNYFSRLHGHVWLIFLHVYQAYLDTLHVMYLYRMWAKSIASGSTVDIIYII